MSVTPSIAEKADKMKRYTRLYAIREFLDNLGEWPKTEEEWAVSFVLWYETKRY